MSKVIKIIFILTIIIFSINLIIVPKTYALADMMEAAQKFPEYGEDTAVNQVNLETVSKNIFYPFLAVAVVIAVIVGAIIGIKIMTGTIEEKAKIKEMLVPYAVGLVVIFGTFTIWSTVVKIGTSVVGEGRFDPLEGVYVNDIFLDLSNVKRSYTVGESLTLEGLKVIAQYNNGAVAEITNYTSNPVEGTILNNDSSRWVTITYSMASEEYSQAIIIQKKFDIAINENSSPQTPIPDHFVVRPLDNSISKLTYQVGQKLDPNDIYFAVVLSDGTEIRIQYYEYLLEGDENGGWHYSPTETFTSPGEKIIEFWYPQEPALPRAILRVMVEN